MNIPNLLSLFRIVLVPVFAVIYMSDIRHAPIYAGVIFILAALTDIVDGYIARRFNKITKLGRILDPLADKLLQITALACLALKDIIPSFLCVIFIGKEMLMILGGVLMVRRVDDVIPSNWFGKSVSFLMSASIAAAIFFKGAADKNAPLLFPILFNTVICLALAALVVYFVKALVWIRRSRENDSDVQDGRQ